MKQIDTMFQNRFAIHTAAVLLFAALSSPQELRAAMPESQRMERAKDLIADEQWARAVDELKAAAADPKETNKDEALFWLAHSQNQSRDFEGAVETIRRLERAFPASRWVKPARSLRIEIAQRLQRNDVLWWHTLPPTPPVAPVPPTPAPPGAFPLPPRPAEAPRTPSPTATPVAPLPAPPTRAPAAARPPMPPVALPPPPPPAIWVPEDYLPDTDLRIQALGSLIRTDGAKVIPMLKEIALNADRPNESRRALFVLVTSGRPEARSTVVDVAKTGPEIVRIAAVRELGRFGGPAVSNDLVQVYSTGSDRLKHQVVTSLGSRDEAGALLRIAQSETDRRLRDLVIVTLGQARGGDQLFMLYSRASADAKRPIIMALFHAQAEDQLIRIAGRERDEATRREVLTRLRLLGTPKAMEYVDKAERR
jgi:HEAT repeat protein